MMANDMVPIDDAAARVEALTAISRTMLVEAGAGTGKTSVLAGRVVTLLAAGRDPGSIAAISFTEFSAAELRERIAAFVDAAIAAAKPGMVLPADLLPAFPAGQPTPEQAANLRRARDGLDRLSGMTIHGFCQTLLTPYPVEANIDPGATVIDREASDLLFEETWKVWLRERLAGPGRPGDVFVALFMADEKETRQLVKDCADHIRKNRGAAVEECPPLVGELDRLRDAARRFREFLTAESANRCPQKIADTVAGLEGLLASPPSGGDAVMLPWALGLHCPQACAIKGDKFTAPIKISSGAMWKAAGGSAISRPEADRLNVAATALYVAARDAYDALRDAAAGRALHLLAAEAETVVARYDGAKREAALIDFDDLLEKTRRLLGSSPAVRAALGRRYPTVLVDEFQDTDPKQMEILWRLCGEPPDGGDAAPWQEWRIRPGSLFLVADPKQSLYRFRGGDLPTYQRAAELLSASGSAATVHITRNFRSRAPILHWVNGRFAPVFTGVDGQAARSDLTPHAEDTLDAPAVCRLEIGEEERTSGRLKRDIEAELVAQACTRLIGSFMVRDRNGDLHPCEASDIALLTPTSTDLWRYERALEDAGLSVAAQAGKGFFRRQEVQDLIALARTLADDRDRLALGALLRGPLVGLPDSVLLDAVEAQPVLPPGQEPRLHIGMEPASIPDPTMRSAIERLAALRTKRRTATPHMLLGWAIEQLQVRPKLRQRGGRVAERALANVDLFLDMARAYDVRGLKAFADAMRGQWEEATRTQDARPDADRQSVNLMTIHSAKGLEWAVVILVNLSGTIYAPIDVAMDRLAGRFHMKAFGRSPVGCEAAMDLEGRHDRQQRERLCYVAATRARDLLLLPDPWQIGSGNLWLKVVDLGLDNVDAIVWPDQAGAAPARRNEAPNTQDRDRFVAEADVINELQPRIERITPSRNEDGRAGDGESDVAVAEATEEVAGAVAAG
jgi:exodeoxyribonuclease-5